MSVQPVGAGTDHHEGTISVMARHVPAATALHAWDRLVNATAGSDVTQLTAWARLRGRVGYAPLYLLAFQAGELVGGGQIMYRRVPVLGSIGYLPYGPVISTAVRSAASSLTDCGRLAGAGCGCCSSSRPKVLMT